MNLSVVEYKGSYGQTALKFLAQPQNNEWFNGYMLLSNPISLKNVTKLNDPKCDAETAELLAKHACEHFQSDYGVGIVGESLGRFSCGQVVYCILDKRTKAAVSLKKITNQSGNSESEFYSFIAQRIYEDFLDR